MLIEVILLPILNGLKPQVTRIIIYKKVSMFWVFFPNAQQSFGQWQMCDIAEKWVLRMKGLFMFWFIVFCFLVWNSETFTMNDKYEQMWALPPRPLSRALAVTFNCVISETPLLIWQFITCQKFVVQFGSCVISRN